MAGSNIDLLAGDEYVVIAKGAFLADDVTLAEDSDWVVGAARDLDIVEWGSWDADKARDSMFEAGFDVAKRGHLVYDANNDDKKGGYKLPFAAVEDGELVAVKEGLRAAASRLPQTDIPDDVKERARSVLDSYFERMDSEEDSAEGEKSIPSVFLPDDMVDLYYVHNGRTVKYGRVVLDRMRSAPDGSLLVEFKLLR